MSRFPSATRHYCPRASLYACVQAEHVPVACPQVKFLCSVPTHCSGLQPHDERARRPCHGSAPVRQAPICALRVRESDHQLPVAISLLSRFFFNHMEWSHLWAMAKGSSMVTVSPSQVPIRILLKARASR
mmetsp:Transcript_65413/g.144727  ORF Transcript_65413/g.144727 Transcript_65413/m.144727 type:complete len:130 (-) Transcript_65413:638-1027(-)